MSKRKKLTLGVFLLAGLTAVISFFLVKQEQRYR